MSNDLFVFLNFNFMSIPSQTRLELSKAGAIVHLQVTFFIFYFFSYHWHDMACNRPFGVFIWFDCGFFREMNCHFLFY